MSLQDEIDELINNIEHELGYFDASHIPEVRKAAQEILNKVLDAAVKSMEFERNLENDSDESEYPGVSQAKISYNYAVDQMVNTVNKLRPES